MIKKFIESLLGGGAGRKPKFGKRQEIGPQEHGIDPSLVDERAVNVVRTLKEAGHQAYIVGGAVRDLLLGLRPKDFDVATDATPEQVKGLFRRAFIIGRRFRIVHVVYGRGREHEVIEVSTFRAYMDNAAAETVAGNEKTSRSELAGMKHAVDASGRVLRDNVWGPQEEDATRRDFTINAMYYDPETQTLVDYHGGIKDSGKKMLRMIGDPVSRYREDPVRIIRAVRFAAKLSPVGFKLEPKTGAALKPALGLLADVPQSRLFDEMLKLLQTGHAVATIEQLRGLELATGIYPLLDLVVERADQPFVRAALQDTDRRVQEGKPVAPSFLLASVLWSDVRDGWAGRLEQKQHPFPALQDAIDDVFNARIGDVSGRGKLAADMREIWMMQPRFEKRTGSSPFSLVEQPRFRAGFDFMRLRADAGEVDVVLADWWQEFSVASDAGREDLLVQVRQEQHKGARRVRVVKPQEKASPAERPASSGEPADVAPAEEGEHIDAEPGAVPAKRRRRRRKPAGAAGGGAAGAGERPAEPPAQ
ncbi:MULTISPECIES: polynucleotide adenylyltransferase PcnB [Ramlibacter]|uniref:Poly(A) polymerase I n=1 Tax=Ramlibacter pinisoli TaxID=2682844 RepID=A0A6N8IS62_9BURK|nr:MULTISPECIES: polynucleotide adenylyltransferase PcnB [Ramlibacter]MBA2964084.1 polynucleotide adenylyltransferase PcnB [Ramlibacter sp. CGMCC 1.13660]MVQ29050.1 polynucleotide adenylyltransferase PcnB [Ramlibacter pinisoli]